MLETGPRGHRLLVVLGELVKTTSGKWISHPPTRCPNGHTLGPNRSLVGHQACLGHGGAHTTWTCLTCDATVLVEQVAPCRFTGIGNFSHYRAVAPPPVLWPPIGLQRRRHRPRTSGHVAAGDVDPTDCPLGDRYASYTHAYGTRRLARWCASEESKRSRRIKDSTVHVRVNRAVILEQRQAHIPENVGSRWFHHLGYCDRRRHAAGRQSGRSLFPYARPPGEHLQSRPTVSRTRARSTASRN